MSQTDSFIDEVTEEVRRDKLFRMLKRYGWIGALAIFVIVGGAAWNEYSKAQVRAEAEVLGDALLASLQRDAPSARAEALAAIDAGSTQGLAVRDMLLASELAEAGDAETAAQRLRGVALNPDIPEIYRRIAAFKALLISSETQPAAARRDGFSEFAVAGNPFRLLAEEQLALIDIESGNPQAALDRFQSILGDAETTAGLQQRAVQAIVALGGEPDLPEGMTGAEQEG